MVYPVAFDGRRARIGIPRILLLMKNPRLRGLFSICAVPSMPGQRSKNQSRPSCFLNARICWEDAFLLKR